MRALLLFALLTLASAASAARVHSIDQETPVEGTFTGVDKQDRLNVTVKGKEEPVSLRLDGIREIDFQRSIKAPAKEDARFRFVFADGSVLFGDVMKQEGDDAENWLKIKSLSKGDIKMRYDGLQRIERREDATPDKDVFYTEAEQKNIKAGLEWRLFKSRGTISFACTEMLIYPNKLNYLLDINRPDDEFNTIWSDIRSVVRKARDEEPFDKLYGVFTTKQSERFVGRVESWKDGEIKLLSRYFDRITIKEADLANAIFRNGRFLYLSDMKVDEAKEYPFLRTTKFKAKDHLFPYKNDKAQGGGAITLKGKTYAKGVGVHAISKLTYKLDKRYARFLATIGIDDSAGKKASVVFRVYVDGKEVKFKQTAVKGKDGKKPETLEKLSSGVMRKSSTPIAIEVDVKRAEKMTIVVEAADNADIHDRANWAGAMLVR